MVELSYFFSVQAYMGHIQQNAEVAVRDMLKLIGRRAIEKTGRSELRATDSMDDGSPVQLKVTIDIEDGKVRYSVDTITLVIIPNLFLYNRRMAI